MTCRLPSPGHQLPAAQAESSMQASIPVTECVPAPQQASIPSLEQPAALCRPAGQTAHVLHLNSNDEDQDVQVLHFHKYSSPGDVDWLPTWYCPAPQPL